LHPYEVFSKAGYDITIVSETGSASVDEASVTSMANGGDKKKYEDKQFPLHALLAQMKTPADINPTDYCAIYFAGGHAACIDFPKAVGLQRLTARIYENGGTVGADCHGHCDTNIKQYLHPYFICDIVCVGCAFRYLHGSRFVCVSVCSICRSSNI
jgi:putative intracellular protease/amidase